MLSCIYVIHNSPYFRYSIDQLKELYITDDKHRAIKKHIKEADTLIIDEISMISMHILDTVETLCRFSKDSEQVMGGLQVILVGDFHQLSPVPTPEYGDFGGRAFCHPHFANIVRHTFVLDQVNICEKSYRTL